MLVFDAGMDDVERIEQEARGQKVPLKVIRDTQAGGCEAYGRKLILVRPDQFIAWCGDEAPNDVSAMITQATGQ